MPTEWTTTRVGDVADSISETHHFGKDQLIFLNTSDVLGGNILHHNYSPVKDWPGQAKKSVRKDDILFSEIRPANGRYAYVDIDADDYVVSTKLMVVRARRGRILPRFLYHFLTHKRITAWLQHLAESRSGTFPQITFDQIAELELALPPVADQGSISAFIDELDDKIAVNQQMSETLETMARATFKSWFVDFDPVRAKAEGRQPFGMDAATTALFPDSFQASPLGEIPKGWKAGAIGDFVTAVGGSTPSTKEPRFWDGSLCFATPKDMSSLQFPILLETERKITEAGLGQISSGLLPKGTVLLSSRAPIGYLALTEIPVAVNQGIIAMICDKELPTVYVLHWVKENIETIVANANGTTFLEISKANFRPILALAPPSPVLERFTKVVETLHASMVSNERESKTLAAIRDALLPKLISGEIRIKDATRLAGVT